MQVMQHELDKKKITYISVTAAVQGGGLGYEDQSQIDRGRDFKKCQSATLIKMYPPPKRTLSLTSIFCNILQHEHRVQVRSR